MFHVVGDQEPRWLREEERWIFVLDSIPTGCMPTRYVWVGDVALFRKLHTSPCDGSFDYDAPIPAALLKDPAALLACVARGRWGLFADIMEREYGIRVMDSPIVEEICRSEGRDF